jgi:predicted enzyme related to lactoylglutathione lyase
MCPSVLAETPEPPPPTGAQHELADLSWMGGRWTGRSDEIQMEEIWMEPSGGTMLGLHRDVSGNGSTFFEYLRIEATARGPAYIASPQGRGATDFLLVSLEDQRAVFENLEHDFPQRIIYWRQDHQLHARVEGEIDGRMRGEEWVWDRTPFGLAMLNEGGETMGQEEHDKRIDYIEFATTDIERSKAFYSAVFGWKTQDWGPDYTSFEDGRLTGGFRPEETVEGGGPLVVIYTVDLEGMAAEIKANGGTIVVEIFSFPGGRRFHFKDPVGNELAVWSDK